MRLLYFINQIENSGGIERIVIDKVNYLAQIPDYELHLVYYGKSDAKSFYPIDASVKLWAIDEDTSTHSFTKKLRSISHIYHEVCNVVDSVHPDVIVNANVRIISYFLPLVYKSIPKIVELHFTYEGLQIMNEGMYGKNSWKSAVNNVLRRLFYARYDKCVVLVNDDIKAWGFRNLVVIPNFTNLTFIPSNCCNREKMVINVGRLEDQKDHQLLIEAWKTVNKKYPDWRLEIWGGGSLKKKLQRQISETGLQDSVFLKGQTQHIDKEYTKASIFALSSKYEGMPLVAIEAMTAGIPCVSFDISGIRDVITDGEDGAIVGDHTPEALAQGIVQMIDNEQLRNNMSIKSIKKVSRFEKAIVMRKWINLFDLLIKK
jgi:glycosyltransferase involved in cell wall biosynthesis